MRNLNRLCASVLCVLLPLLAVGCLGQQTRTHVLTPAINAGAAYAAQAANKSPTVDSANVDRFLAAVEAGDVGSLKKEWPAVYAAAVDGIARRTDVSEAVKPSLREPLDRLNDDIGRLK